MVQRLILSYNLQQKELKNMWTEQEKKDAYELLLLQQKGLIEAETDWLATLANSSALLNETLKETVFAGYYLYNQEELILGPFQGRVSCTRIKMGKGVCGESAEKRETLIVDDVKTHENYISCDSAARSEIVVPMVKNGQLVGVLDLDCSETNGYDHTDQIYLEKYVEILLSNFNS
ncbi:GAF domain protein [Enterococcus faecalis 13-SD-W-01]|jgi:L-methionine (R)-S-oxide reductase|nr:GAF domain protein [Enterococcus faecalis 13-SD-W-01]